MRSIKSLASELRVTPKVLLVQLVSAGINARNVYDELEESDIAKFRIWLSKQTPKPRNVVKKATATQSTRKANKTSASSTKKGELKALLKKRAAEREAEIQKHHKVTGFTGYIRKVHGSFGAGKK